MSIRSKVVLVIISVMTLVFGILLGVVTVNTFTRARELEDRMRDTLRPLVQRWVEREQWLENRTWSEFQYKLSELNPPQGPSLMRRYVIVESDGRISSMGGLTQREAAAFIADDGRLQSAIRDGQVVLYPEERYIAVPLTVAGKNAGAIKLEVNTGPRATLQDSFFESFVTLTIILVLSTVALIAFTYLLLDRRVLKPLGLLVEASADVADGNLSQDVPGEEGRDEMARLVSAFNAMMREVRDYREHLERLVAEEKARVAAAQRRLVIAQRLAATGTLAAGIAHEVNNPLGGMINATRRLLKDAPETGRQKDYLELILEGLVRVQDTVKKILQFTPREVKPQMVDMRDVATKSIDLISHRIGHREIDVVNALPEDLPSIFGDPSELQQVFLNILINAVDALSDRSGHIEMRGNLLPGHLEIEIEDNGSGMTEDQIARAFDLFYTTKEVGKGSGLGLAIVHNIIENHNGRMEIRSHPGEGTTVWIQFPIISDPASGRFRLVRP